MPLMFHSTSYSPDRAQAEINKLLRLAGARRISVEYGDHRRAIGMTFSLETPRGEREFLLPVRIDRVKSVLAKQGVLRGAGQRRDPAASQAHAEAVAWRTLLEWLKLQLALVETEQAAADEIMLPYMLVEQPTGVVSLYEQYSGKALPAPQAV